MIFWSHFQNKMQLIGKQNSFACQSNFQHHKKKQRNNLKETKIYFTLFLQVFLCLCLLVAMRPKDQETMRKIMVAAVLVCHIDYGCHASQEADKQGGSRTQYTPHSLSLVIHFSKISSTNQSYHNILKYCHKLESKPPTQDHG